MTEEYMSIADDWLTEEELAEVLRRIGEPKNLRLVSDIFEAIGM